MKNRKSSRLKIRPIKAYRNITVKFYQEFNTDIKGALNRIKSSIRNPRLSKAIKAKLKRKLNDALVFQQKSYKVFMLRYQKLIKITLGVDVSNHLGYIVNLWTELCLENGPVEALKLFKQLMDIYNRISLSQNFNCPEFLRLNSKGEPRVLGPLLELSKGSMNERRAGLSSLLIVKLVRNWDKSFSTETITRSGRIPKENLDSPPEIGSYFEKAKTEFGSNIEGVDINKLRQCYIDTLEEMFPKSERPKRFIALRSYSSLYISARGGPNGPSLLTWCLDHVSLSKDPVNKKLYKSLKELSIMTNNKALNLILSNFEDEECKFQNSKDESRLPINSRLSIKEEPWAKRRVFAICDALSQSSLKGFHTLLFRWFETLQEDGTLNQDRVTEMVRVWTLDPGNGPDSADLTAATDSSPVDVQSEIVTAVTGNSFAKLWRIICSNRSFKAPEGVDEFVSYSRGQPMGLLSSWAMLATWNHVMLRTSMKYVGIKYDPENPCGVIIGDDIVLRDPRLFPIYRVLVKVLQEVDISPTKGYHRVNYNGRNPIIKDGQPQRMIVAEIAKRIFCDGQEYTVVPPDEVKTSFENSSQFPELVRSLKKRLYPVDTLNISNLHALAGLCYHSRQALVLATFPNPDAPFRVTSSEEESLLKSIIWYDPDFSQELFGELMIKELKGLLIPTLGGVLGELNRWIEYALTSESVKVKAWDYRSESQGLVIKLAADLVLKQLNRLLSPEIDKQLLPEGSPLRWQSFKRYIGSFQTIFELETLLKRERPDSIKVEKRRRFVNNIISTVVKKTTERLNTLKSIKEL